MRLESPQRCAVDTAHDHRDGALTVNTLSGWRPAFDIRGTVSAFTRLHGDYAIAVGSNVSSDNCTECADLVNDKRTLLQAHLVRETDPR